MTSSSHSSSSSPGRARASGQRHVHRLVLLNQVIGRWLGMEAGLGAGSPAGDRLLGTTVTRWLHTAGDGPLFAQFPGLVAELQLALPSARGRTAADFDKAFAGLLLQQACAEVAREAGRSGRAEAFVCLKPYLLGNPDANEQAQLAEALQLSPQAVDLALGSLRRRLRERIEAALNLWANSPDSRDTLRRHLRAALTEHSP